MQRVDEKTELDSVTDGERQALQERSAGRVLAAERLHEPREQRPVQIEDGARDQLRDPAPWPAADPSGRSYIAFTKSTPGSVSSGPTIPETKSAENSFRSASTKQTMSPPVTSSERHSTSPLPGRAGILGRIVSRCTTRAPAARATPAVRSVEPESITTSSSTSGTRSVIRARRISATISPTVSSSFSAGSTTLTEVPEARFAAIN